MLAYEGGTGKVCLAPPKGTACRRARVGIPLEGLIVISVVLSHQKNLPKNPYVYYLFLL